MNQTKKTQLEVNVIAYNEFYKHAKICFDYEKEFYSQFIGKAIFKVDGTIKEKYKHESQTFDYKLPDGTHFTCNYWFRCEYGRFDINIKTCINGGSYDVKPVTAFCKYTEESYTMFDINANGEIVESAILRDGPQVIEYNQNDLLELAAKAKEAAEAYEKAAGEVPYIFRSVLGVQRLTN